MAAATSSKYGHAHFLKYGGVVFLTFAPPQDNYMRIVCFFKKSVWVPGMQGTTLGVPDCG